MQLGDGHSTNELGFDIGAGLIGYFSNRVGLRGDVRYFRDVHDTSAVNAASAGFGQFHFIRASVGVVFRPQHPIRLFTFSRQRKRSCVASAASWSASPDGSGAMEGCR
jgi:hypothetical protein